jgi:hypothetical protein
MKFESIILISSSLHLNEWSHQSQTHVTTRRRLHPIIPFMNCLCRAWTCRTAIVRGMNQRAEREKAYERFASLPETLVISSSLFHLLSFSWSLIQLGSWFTLSVVFSCLFFSLLLLAVVPHSSCSIWWKFPVHRCFNCSSFAENVSWNESRNLELVFYLLFSFHSLSQFEFGSHLISPDVFSCPSFEWAAVVLLCCSVCELCVCEWSESKEELNDFSSSFLLSYPTFNEENCNNCV